MKIKRFEYFVLKKTESLHSRECLFIFDKLAVELKVELELESKPAVPCTVVMKVYLVYYSAHNYKCRR